MSLVSKRKPLNWAGDTIVEVLIVIMVIGTVLASGYAIAVTSLQSIQTTQERTFALKIAEGQLESLKAEAIKDPSFIAAANASPAGFCLDDSLKSWPDGNSPTNNYTTDPFPGSYNSHCKKDPVGSTDSTGCTGFCYYYGIKPDPANSNNFTVSVRWDGPGGNREQVQLSYRLYQ